MKIMYKKFAKYYDLLSEDKNYKEELKLLTNFFSRAKIDIKEVLEIGCGTGNFLHLLEKKGFSVVGLDLNKEMLKIAGKKLTKGNLLQGDMKNFNFKKKFDAILCLYNTIHYNLNYNELKKTLKNYYRHLKKGSMLIFDMGFNEERFNEKIVDVKKFQHKDDTLIYFSKPLKKGNKGVLKMAYILFKNNKINFEKEDHKIGIFSTFKVKKILENMNFSVDLKDGYTNNNWNKDSKNIVLLVCIKN